MGSFISGLMVGLCPLSLLLTFLKMYLMGRHMRYDGRYRSKETGRDYLVDGLDIYWVREPPEETVLSNYTKHIDHFIEKVANGKMVKIPNKFRGN